MIKEARAAAQHMQTQRNQFHPMETLITGNTKVGGSYSILL